jgi:hypothetical protein
MHEILIVPDVHGRNFWLPALDYPGEVIFLGDYVDPYIREGFYDEDAFNVLSMVVDFKRNNPERVTLLIGNHEMQYHDEKYETSRFSEEYYDRFHEILTGEPTRDFFQICKQEGKYLFIHAGVTKGWYDLHYSEFRDLGVTLEEQLNKFFSVSPEAFHEAAWRYRGGLDDSGSPLWADLREFYDEPEPFDDRTVQVVGHTQLGQPDPILWNRMFFLDNRQLYLLRDDKIEKYVTLLV